MNLTGWPAPIYDAGLVWVEKLRAAGITATNDPRSATPPCVLVSFPPKDNTDGRLPCGLTVAWQFVVMAPGLGNADAWLTLERLDTAVRAVLGGRAASTPTSYPHGSDNVPAYLVEFTEDISTV